MSDEKDVAAQIDSTKRDVDKLVTSGGMQKALELALNVPIAKDEKLKSLSTGVVMTVLAAVKEADIAKMVDSLSEADRSTAMKFVYRGMSLPGNSAPYNQLLKWHSALYDKDGPGSIMRVLVDKNL